MPVPRELKTAAHHLKTYRPGLLFSCLTTMLFAIAPALQAQEADYATVLEEVIVTAQKRDENLQDVPISVVVMSGEQISSTNLNTIEDLQTYIPNLFITDTQLGPKLTIRGIGSGVNQGFEQSVGIYVDGVYFGRAQQSRMTLMDIERVEVLRGPQSILFGKNSISGALNIITARPTETLEAGFNALYGWELEEKKFDGYLSGPIGDSFAARIAAHVRDTDGYIENLTLGRDEPAREERLVRGIFDWYPNDATEVSLKVESGSFETTGQQLEVNGDPPAEAGPFTGLTYAQVLLLFGQHPSVANNFRDGRRSANGDLEESDNREIVLTVDYGGWADLQLTSITAWNEYELDEFCDCDGTGGNVFAADVTEDHDQFSQEIRFTSPGGEAIDWMAGAYYQDNSLEYTDRPMVDAGSILVPLIEGAVGPGAGALIADTSAPRYFKQDSETFSVFGQLNWRARDRMVVTVGARWSHETKRGFRSLGVGDLGGNPLPPPIEPFTAALYSAVFNINTHALEGKRSKDAFMPSARLQYDLTDTAMGYLSYTRGAKSGGFDARSNNTPELGGSFEFDDEKASSWEAGVKLELAGGAATLNAALYYTDYEDMQLSSFDGVLGFNVGNAAEAVAKGFELEGRWQASEHLLLSGSVAMTDFEFKEYFGQCYWGQVPDAPDGINCDYRGQTNQFVPDYSGVFSAVYSRPAGEALWFTFGLDWLFTDEFLASSNLDPRQVQDAYSKINARLAIASGDRRWEVALVGTNLTDESIQTLSGDLPLAGATFGTPAWSAYYEAPRSVALRVSLRY